MLKHAGKIGNARKAGRYFGVGRSSFYRWRDAYQEHGEAGLKCAKSIPKNPANQTPDEICREGTLSAAQVSLGVYPDRLVFGALSRHHIQVDVKCLTFKCKNRRKGPPFPIYSDRPLSGHCLTMPCRAEDATRVRALKVSEKHTQANAIDVIEHRVGEESSSGHRSRPPLHCGLRRTHSYASGHLGGSGSRYWS